MYIDFKTAVILSWICLLSTTVVGQNNDYVVHVNGYTVANGLGSNHVLDCFQDSRGMIWMVREGGIERFDGEEFKHFNLQELKNTPNMSILLEDQEHDLWIRRNNKTIVYLNVYTEKLRTSEEKFGFTFPKEVDWAIAGINNSYLLQDAGSTIFRYRPGKSPKPYYATPGKVVSPLIEFSNGIAWSECNNDDKGGFLVATDSTGKEIIKIPYQQDHIYGKGVWGGDTIHYLTRDSFYLASLQGIILRKSLKEMVPGYQFNDPYDSGQFQKVVVEQDRGLVWVYLPFQLMVFDKSLKLLYTFDPKKYFIQSSTVFDLFVDNQNHTWLATFDGIYNINFKLNPFHQYLSQDPSNKATYKPVSIRKMCKGKDGNVYVVAAPFLVKVLPDGTMKQALKFPKIEGVDLAGIDSDDKGNLWYFNKALYKFNVYSSQLSKYAIPADDNWYIKYLDDQVLFGFPIMAVGDLNSTPVVTRQFERFDSLDRLDIYDLLKLNDHEYLVGTDAGLYILDPISGQYNRYWEEGKGENYLPSNNVRHIYVDKQGDIWMATTDGLVIWRKSTGEKHLYGIEDGVQTYCNAVLEDDFGNLWISSNFGLIQFEKKTGRARTFLVTDGLPSDEFNRLAYFKDETTGQMYLGGINGFVRFHPRDLFQRGPDIAQSANLVLTECLIFSGKSNKEEDIRTNLFQDNKIDIFPGDLFLRIKFAITDYTKPVGIQYSYLIEGYNKNWHTGNENELLLSGLPYGHYTLHVKAVSASGIPYEKEMRIPIHVWPPIYLQTWFVILCIILSGLAIAWYIQRRTKLLTERSAMLEKVVGERTEVIENQRKSLKELYDSKSRLYANITHEFRTPLTLIIGPAQKVLQSEAAAKNLEVRQNLSNILQNSEQLLGLVNQMLDLNKLESKAMKPAYHQSDIMGFLLQIVEKFQNYAASRELSLTFKADPAQLVMDFDAEFFEKVLNNLLSNAVKFTPPGGAIQVKAQRTGPFLNIEVIDSGTGIEADKLPYIFERYYQADNSVTRRSEGTGIGLALVKELVDLLEGSIQVSSKPGQETIFTLCLPIRNLSPTKEEITPMGHWESKYAANLSIMQDDDSEYEMTKPSVIIIEDNPAVASFAASCLKEKYQVLTITNSRQGLDAVLEQLPDLVICDIMMPELDGYQVCAAIKSDERSSHIPVMFLSAVTEQADRLKRLNAGADAYVSKPFREEELQTVAAHLHQTRAHLREKYLALASVQESTAIATKPPHESLNPFEVEFLQKAKSLVLAKIQESEFDGNELARALNFSSSQLHRKLSALTGLPAGRYIYRIRLEVAKDLLQRKDLTIAEIAYQVGFSDPAYFTKMFTKEFGQSPSKYRG